MGKGEWEMEKKMNNKGFSLVELIIVIAIMVVLVAVLAPQYLRYVERSRIAADTQTTVEFINVMQVIAADPEIDLTSGTDYSITKAGGDEGIDVSGPLATILTANGFLDQAAIDGAAYQSTAYTDAELDLSLEFNNNVWTVTADDNSDINTSGTITPTP
ncbi:MAG: prepilin-type N-terminal cleavage/methylation domain-containing protein [Lachnospiraceae bacterium]|jgi:type IV pilus assembly protein PilA|nr:prepilin-type N-terminal cleavage/methylation domain-containing protein [Lachnospiraceae bacterium]